MVEMKQLQIKNLPHPYQKELDTCAHLIAYCHNLKKKAGLEIDADEQARAAQQQLLTEQTRENV